ncbi:MAG: bifunctional oligoribonuclease/PAP phosphatase NrnA [Clostridia bacterium]|nr:bifunctional oligoribonuclease/PAP phosphatase NrnA [Clostridia bacterium]
MRSRKGSRGIEMIVDLRELADAIKRCERPLLTGHIMPDGDCIGSVLALALLLEGQGKQVMAVSPDPVPLVYRFLPGIERLAVGAPPAVFEPDAFIMLDCSDPERVGPDLVKYLDKPGVTVINVDHHVSTRPYAHYNYIDPGAAAVGEIVYDLSFVLGASITHEVATCLYTAIFTDTGSFRYDNTTSGTHRRVARLIDQGVSPAEVNTAIYEERRLESIRLLHAALGSVELNPSGQVAWASLTTEREAALGATDEDGEGIINYVRMINGVEVAALFRETKPSVFKVSLRSKRYVDVSALAQEFGGGGHPRAAGCTISGALDEVVEAVIRAAETRVAEDSDDRRA